MAYSLPIYRVINQEPDAAREDLREAMRRFGSDSLNVRAVTPGILLPFLGMSTAAATGSLGLLDGLGELAVASSPNMPMVGQPTRAAVSWYGAAARLAMGARDTSSLVRSIRDGIARLESAGPNGGAAGTLRAQSIGVPYTAYLATRDSTFVGVVRRWLPSGSQVLELDASLALDRGDTASARTIAERFPTPAVLRTRALSGAGIRALTQAEVRARLGDLRGALDTYEAISPSNFSIGLAEPGAALYTRSFLTRARLYEQVGDTEAATRAYATFVDWWSGADPALHGELREAQSALQRLRDRAPSRAVPASGR